MSFDFWNNPLVVSAFRVKYRRGGIFNLTALYLLGLVVLGAVLQYYDHELKGNWVHFYYLALMGIQFTVSGLLAGLSTATSIKSELTQRTLDFQRIAALSPRQILLGKLLGEPALAYLLAIASIPLGVLCWVWGAVSGEAMVLLYVQLASSTLLFGCLGLLNRLEPGKGKAAGGQGVGWVVLPLVLVGQAMAGGTWLLAIPWVAAIEGLLSPLPSFFGIGQQEPWLYGLPFFGIEIPFLLVTPLSQLALAWLCFQTMVRQLLNPLNPSFSKGMAYGTLLVVDVLTAGVLFNAGTPVWDLRVRASAFCLVHLLVGYFLIVSTTPWRESFHSWVWRFRQWTPIWRDRWLGDRSPMGPALVTFCFIGLVSLVCFILMPEIAVHGTTALENPLSAGYPNPFMMVALVAATTVLLILALGSWVQWTMLLAGRGGMGTFSSILCVLVVAPHVAGAYYQNNWSLALSPSAQFGNWLSELPRMDGANFLNPLPLMIVYGGILLFTAFSFRRRIRYYGQVVQRKLQRMKEGQPREEAIEGRLV
jgi:hypothetical protein